MSEDLVRAIKERVNIAEDVIIPDLGEPKRVGARLSWVCPFHPDKNPSLFSNPDGQSYRCFGCGARGDAFTWMMERNGWGFPKALAYLADLVGLQADGPPDPARPPRPARPAIQAPEVTPPAAAWQTRAVVIVTRSQDVLWEDAGAVGLDYLHGRGLTDATMRAWGLGFCPRDIFEPPTRWGLTGKKIYFPRGVVIPHQVGGDMWAVKVRRFVDNAPALKEQRGKYGGPRGGMATLYGAGKLQADGRPLFLVEAELDALLLWQEAGDLVDVAALATASRRLSWRWQLYLLPYPRIFAALDSDGAGAANMGRLAALSARISPAPIPAGNDVTEYHQAGGDVRAWVLDTIGGGEAAPVLDISPPTMPHGGFVPDVVDYLGRPVTIEAARAVASLCDLNHAYGHGPSGYQTLVNLGISASLIEKINHKEELTPCN